MKYLIKIENKYEDRVRTQDLYSHTILNHNFSQKFKLIEKY
jgi:hypothetical protein